MVCLFWALCVSAVQAAESQLAVAVMPFKNISRNPADDWLQESFSENLTMGLGRISTLRLVERTDIQRILTEQGFGQTAFAEAESAPRLGRMVGARYVLLGNFQKMGPEILVNVKLINVETGAIETHSLTQIRGSFSNLFMLQEQLAESLIQKLQPEQSTQKIVRPQHSLSGTHSTRAHEAYIKARLFREQLGEKNVQEAITLLNTALSEDPNYARAAAELAGVYLDRFHSREVYSTYTAQDLSLAETFARRAVLAAPNSAMGYSILARVLEGQGSRSEALRMAQKALELEKNSDSILAYLTLKYALNLETQVSAARIESELQALGADFNDPQILFTLGGLFLGEIHTQPAVAAEKARFFYEQAHRKNPYNPYYSFTLTAFHLLQGQTDKARDILLPLLEANPESIALLISGAEVAHRLLPDLGEIEPEKRFEQRYPDYTLVWSHLTAFYRQQQQLNPDNLILLLSGARILPHALSQEALTWTRRAIDLFPDSAEACFQLAELTLRDKGDAQSAERWFQEGVRRMGASPQTALSAVRYLMQTRQFKLAHQYLDQALAGWKEAAKSNPALRAQYTLSLNLRAQLYTREGQIARALKVYQEIVRGPLPALQQGLAWQRMAEAYARQQQHVRAFEAYGKYLQLFPKHLQNAQARNIYSGYFAHKSLAEHPEDPQLLNDTAQAYLVQGNASEALKFLTRAQQLAPANAVIYYNLGLAWFSQKNYTQAIMAFEQATRLSPAYTKAWYNLGLSCFERGQKEQARLHWQKALVLDPGFEPARQALQVLFP